MRILSSDTAWVSCGGREFRVSVQDFSVLDHHRRPPPEIQYCAVSLISNTTSFSVSLSSRHQRYNLYQGTIISTLCWMDTMAQKLHISPGTLLSGSFVGAFSWVRRIVYYLEWD